MKLAMQYGFDHAEGTRDEREIMKYFIRYLRQSGIEVELPEGDEPDLRGYDIVHLFGLGERTHLFSRIAKRHGVPVVVTPQYWNEDFPIYYNLDNIKNGAGIRQPSPEIIESVLNDFYFEKRTNSNKMRRYTSILDTANLVLASGKCEGLQLCRDFNLAEDTVVELPIGIDLAVGIGKPDAFVKEYEIEDFMLCVGQLTPRKNQHVLIDITRELDIPLVLIGPTALNGGQYLSYCREIAHDKVYFLGEIDAPMLKSAYQAAKLFALPSQFELPGMSYMPAALAGLPIVATNRGAAWDYLGGHVEYCDPEDPGSVFGAVSKCLDSEPESELKGKLLKNFSWGKTTLELVRHYHRIFSS